MAEDLADYLAELGIKVQWLHSEVDTLERVEILRDLRLGVYDVLVGINLLREGLDLPEVTLVAILDADKEGFLRSGGSLIQVIGRAARNIGGRVVMYADRVTDSMRAAIDETDRRREKQVAYNVERGITPETIMKEIRDIHEGLRRVAEQRAELQLEGKEPEEIAAMMGRLEAQMKEAARNLEFERAAALRDEVLQLRRLREELAAAPGSDPGRRLRRGRGRRGRRREASRHARRPGLQRPDPPERHRGRRRAGARRRRRTPDRWPAPCRTPSSSRPMSTGTAWSAPTRPSCPGCAVFAGTDDEAAGAMPMRVSRFTAWLQANGEPAPTFVGDNWYEVERAAAGDGGHGARPSRSTSCRRATTSSRRGCAGSSSPARSSPTRSTTADPSTAAALLDAIERQDVAFVRELGAAAPELSSDPIDRLYAARDALTDALEAAGPYHDGVRRILRLAIADDLRAAEALRAERVIDLATAGAETAASRRRVADSRRRGARRPARELRAPPGRDAALRRRRGAGPLRRWIRARRCSSARRPAGARSRPACRSPGTPASGCAAGSSAAGIGVDDFRERWYVT